MRQSKRELIRTDFENVQVCFCIKCIFKCVSLLYSLVGLFAALLMIPADDESAAEGSDELLEDAEDELSLRRPHEKIYGDQQNDFANVRSSGIYILSFTRISKL